MDASFYSSAAWRDLRKRALARDGNRCTVSRLLGGDCSGVLHVHHIDPERGGALDLGNVATVCAHHHPVWEALRRAVARYRQRGWKRCVHRHPYRQGREECERQLNDGRARRTAA